MLFPMDCGLSEVTTQSEVAPLDSIFYQPKPLFPRWTKLRTGHLFKVRWAMDYSKKKIKQVRDIKERTCGNSRGHQSKEKWDFRVFMKKSWNFLGSWLLTFGICCNNDRVFTRSEKSGKVREFGKGLGKVREIRDLLENKKIKEKSRKFLSMQIFNINKKIICTQKCVQLNCIWQSVIAIYDGIICI